MSQERDSSYNSSGCSANESECDEETHMLVTCAKILQS